MADHETSGDPTPGKAAPTAWVAGRLWDLAYSARAGLVVFGVLIGAVIVVSLWEPRWWRGIQDALFATEGQIIVSSPAVYTRQRLVNDRLSQTRWLQDQLKVTEAPDQTFRGIDEVRIDVRSSGTKASISVAKKSPAEGGSAPPAEAGSQDKEKQDAAVLNTPPVNPTSSDLFRMKNAYREEVRSEIMETQLDDRHDIKGNTIYRLAFDVAVLPGAKTNSLAIVKVALAHDSEGVIDDYVTLYYDWMRSMQVVVASSIDAIAAQLSNRQPDLRLNLTMTEFILEAICKLVHEPKSAEERVNSCRAQSGEMTKARAMLSEFGRIYGRFRASALHQRASSTVQAHPKASSLSSEDLSRAVFSFERDCIGFSRPSVAVTLANETADLGCPPTDTPAEGLNGALQLYRQLGQGYSFDQIKSAFELDEAGIPKVCPTGSECLTSEPSRSEYRCFAGGYMLQSLNKPAYASDQGRMPISELFEVALTGHEVGNCMLQFGAKWTTDTIRLFAAKLNNGIELYTYNVSPKNLVQRVATAAETRDAVQALLNTSFEVYGQGASALVDNLRKRSLQSQRIQGNPVIVSFGVGQQSYMPKQEASQQTHWTTEFGWAIAPQFEVDGSGERRHSEKQYSLAAVISVPAWWRSVELEITTCWAERRMFEVHRTAICPQEKNGQTQKQSRRQVDLVRLPGAMSEISYKLGFDVLQEPRLFDVSGPAGPIQLETMRPATLLLRGRRIWRSTEVTVGSQKADEIVVLPNMEGILAKFRCVRRQLPGISDAKGMLATTMVPIKVWTSEGVTEEEAYALLVPPDVPSPLRLCPDEAKDLRAAEEPAPAARP